MTSEPDDAPERERDAPHAKDEPEPTAPRPASASRKLDVTDLGVFVTLVVGYLGLLLRSAKDLGYARDEGFYFQAASTYARWFEALFQNAKHALDPRVVDAYWSANHEHPGLIKSLFALSHLFLQQKHHVFAMEGTSYRFPGMVLAALGVGLVYAWGAKAKGRAAGLAAALLFAMMPRFFYQAHLACFDAAVVTVWSACAFAFWLSLDRGGIAAPLLTGVLFGLALDTKHNAWFLPFLAIAHAVAAVVRARLLGGPARVVAKRAAAALVSMAALGPVVFYALWPWIWHDTKARLLAYARFHLNHEYYNMEFLGRTYWTPPMPRAYPWVMTAATVPTITLLLFALGLFLCTRRSILPPLRRAWDALGRSTKRAARAWAARDDLASTDILWLGAVLVSYGAWLSPHTPIFGGTKHWMTAYPFIALFAGVAFASALDAARVAMLRAKRRGPLGARVAKLARGPVPDVVMAAAVLVAPVTETIRSHPWGLSNYTPLVGGAAGAATLGLNRGFWGFTTGAVVDYLNREVPRNGRVYVHDTAGASWDMLQRDGRLRRDIRGVWAASDADFALYHHEQHMLGQEYQAWVAYGTDRPDEVGGLDGVPVIWVYRRPRE